MPHLRERLLLKLVLKKLKRAPVLLVNGARQTGKSFLVRELLTEKIKNLRFETLDKTANISRAQKNPHLYLSAQKEEECLAVDEAQKVPRLFDEVKAIVDENKRPGQFIFLGSTEFSHRTKIKESLTGRATRATLYPLTLAETQSTCLDNLSVLDRLRNKTRFEANILLKYLDRGGLPGIFAIRNDQERNLAWNDWLDLTLSRDLLQIPGFKADPVLGRSLLEVIAQNPDTQSSEIVRTLGTTAHKVNKHLDALRALFVVNTIPKMPGSHGSESHFICDVGLAKLLGARFETCLRTWAAIELLAYVSYADDVHLRLFTYSGERGAKIDFVLQTEPRVWNAIKIYPFETLDGREFEVLRAFVKARNGAQGFALLPPHIKANTPKGVVAAPWHALG